MARPGFGWIGEEKRTRRFGGPEGLVGGGATARPNPKSDTRFSVPEETAGRPAAGLFKQGWRPLESPNYNDCSVVYDPLSKPLFQHRTCADDCL
jgi:hypothetical protein